MRGTAPSRRGSPASAFRRTRTLAGLLLIAIAACDARPAGNGTAHVPLLMSVRTEMEDTLIRTLVHRQRAFQALLADSQRTGLADFLDMSFVWGPLTPYEIQRAGDTVRAPGASSLVGYFGMLAGFVPPGLTDLTEFEVRVASESASAVTAVVTAVNAARTSCIWTAWRRTPSDPAGWRALRMMPIDCGAAMRGPQVRSRG